MTLANSLMEDILERISEIDMLSKLINDINDTETIYTYIAKLKSREGKINLDNIRNSIGSTKLVEDWTTLKVGDKILLYEEDYNRDDEIYDIVNYYIIREIKLIQYNNGTMQYELPITLENIVSALNDGDNSNYYEISFNFEMIHHPTINSWHVRGVYCPLNIDLEDAVCGGGTEPLLLIYRIEPPNDKN